MSFWDDPTHLPETPGGLLPGESITGRLTALDVRRSRFDRDMLVYTLDNGQERWANTRLWRTMAAARIEVGDTIRITRGPDEAARAGSRPPTTWTVERLTMPALTTRPVQSTAAPRW